MSLVGNMLPVEDTIPTDLFATYQRQPEASTASSSVAIFPCPDIPPSAANTYPEGLNHPSHNVSVNRPMLRVVCRAPRRQAP
jgi:hypothetical protein